MRFALTEVSIRGFTAFEVYPKIVVCIEVADGSVLALINNSEHSRTLAGADRWRGVGVARETRVVAADLLHGVFGQLTHPMQDAQLPPSVTSELVTEETHQRWYGYRQTRLLGRTQCGRTGLTCRKSSPPSVHCRKSRTDLQRRTLCPHHRPAVTCSSSRRLGTSAAFAPPHSDRSGQRHGMDPKGRNSIHLRHMTLDSARIPGCGIFVCDSLSALTAQVLHETGQLSRCGGRHNAIVSVVTSEN